MPCTLPNVYKPTNMLQVTELATKKHPAERLRALQRWQSDGGVMIMGYEMYRILSQAEKMNEECKKELQSILVDPGTVTLQWHDIIKMFSVLCVIASLIETVLI